MSRPAPPRIAVITGANSGIGKECARLLAMRAGSAALTTVVLACRNETKAQEAKHDLEQLTGRSIFHVVLMDVADPASVRAAIPLLPPSIDLLIMNAGGVSPLIVTPTGATCTPTGVTQMTADNLLGHAVLLEGLLQAGRLTTAAVYLGSEAACGVPKLGMAKPVFVSSSTAEFVSVLDGTFFRQHKADQLLHYGQVKLLAALWMAALARRHPQLRLLTISPGNTSGTGAVNKLPWIMRILVKYIAMPIIMPLMGAVHNLETGSRRIIDSVDNAAIPSGAFYASKAGQVSGTLVDQAPQQPGLREEAVQEHAYEAVHKFL